MTTATAPAQAKALTRATEPTLTPFEVIERVITAGDLARMTAPERVDFYWRTCETLGLNPFTRPFEFISLNGKLTMYARKDATDQLRKLNAVTVTDVRREKDDDLGLITVFARGRDKTGREDEATGVVTIKGLSGEALANALMKAETKAKRRLTLSLVGLGFLDESEVDGAERVHVDPQTGEIAAAAKPKSLLESVREQQQALAASPADEPVADQAEDVVEGEGTWLADEATGPEPFTDWVRRVTAMSGLEGDPTQDQREQLTELFRGIPATQRLAGVEALFPGATASGKAALTAAQAAGLLAVAKELGPEQLQAAWAELAAA